VGLVTALASVVINKVVKSAQVSMSSPVYQGRGTIPVILRASIKLP